MRVVNWNVAWAKASSRRGRILVDRIRTQEPEIICLTETYTNLFADDGYLVTGGTHWGYDHADDQRKVLLWSREPWHNAIQAEDPEMPLGRYVRASTDTSLGRLTVLGVCIPWQHANVTGGKRNRRMWEDHLAYLSALSRILNGISLKRTLIIGDFNQRIPRKRVPYTVYSAMMAMLGTGLEVATTGTLEGTEQQTIDHVAHSSDLRPNRVLGLSNHDLEGRKLSDHFGVVVDFEAI